LGLLGLTVSADSTSNRKQNYESKHVALRVTDYKSADTSGSQDLHVDLKSAVAVRNLGIEATKDHTSQTSVESWKKLVLNLSDLGDQSPLMQRLGLQLTSRGFVQRLKGAEGDHANNEKCTSDGLNDWKMEECRAELGEKKLNKMHQESPNDLVAYLMTWNLKKIAECGGQEAWDMLSALEKAKKDGQLLARILDELGRNKFEGLPPADKCEMSLFIWSGCCMHKDQNSFKGGNDEMMNEWERQGWKPSILLANKANAAILRKVCSQVLRTQQAYRTGEGGFRGIDTRSGKDTSDSRSHPQ
jgi:hypothetical protein